MGMVPTYDVRSTASRYSSCSTSNTTIHAFRSKNNVGVSSQPINDTCALPQTDQGDLRKIHHKDSASKKPPHPKKKRLVKQESKGSLLMLYRSRVILLQHVHSLSDLQGRAGYIILAISLTTIYCIVKYLFIICRESIIRKSFSVL